MGETRKWSGIAGLVGLGLLALAGSCEQPAGSPECGETGTFHDAGDLGRYCSYIVIVGGFTCPDVMPFRHDFPTGEVVCSDRETAVEELPEEVCDAVGRDCRPEGGESCTWDATFGGAAESAAQVAAGRDGTVYVALGFAGSVDFGGGVRTAGATQDTALVAFDGYGRYQWDRVLSGETWLVSLAADASGLVVSGSFAGTVDFGGGPRTVSPGPGVFVLALDLDGRYVWDRTFDSAGRVGAASDAIELVARTAIASDGSVRVTGVFGPSTDFGGGVRTALSSFDGFVVAYDRTGTHLWDRTFGGGTSTIALGPGDSIVLGGSFEGSADFGGGVRTADGPSGFVLSLAADGSHRWDRTFSGTTCGDPMSCPPTGVLATSVLDDGSVVIGGVFRDGADFGAGARAHGGVWTGMFVAAYDAAGAHVWDRAYAQNSAAVAMVGLGDSVAITGGFSNRLDLGGGVRTPMGSSDAFVFELTDAGAYVFDQIFPATEIAIGVSIAVTDANNLIVGGDFTRTASFGHGTRTAMDHDAFVTRLCR